MIPNPLNLTDEGELLQAAGYEIRLERRRAPDLHLPTGRLVVCDPLAAPETEPFASKMPRGTFAVETIVADMRDAQRIAYVVIQLSEQRAHRWELAHLADEEVSWGSERLGAHVDSNVLAFMDEWTATAWLDLWHDDDEELERLIRRELRKRSRHGAAIDVGEFQPRLDQPANMLLVDADAGTYVTYIGVDGDEQVVMVVLDFEVLDYEFTPFGLRY